MGRSLVFEGVTGLAEIVDNGIAVNGDVSSGVADNDLLSEHAAARWRRRALRKDRASAAACVLPLTDRELADSQMGTRHGAAIGVTEQSDASVIVVSEETGRISAARNGRIVRLDNRLRTLSERLLFRHMKLVY